MSFRAYLHFRHDCIMRDVLDACIGNIIGPGFAVLSVLIELLILRSFLPFLQETCGSLKELSLREPLRGLDNQEKMYTLCPAMNAFTLSNAKPEDLAILKVSPHSKLRPALRRLTLHNFSS